MNKEKPIATVNEEPTSSTTPDRQINQGGEEATRHAGNVPSPAEQRKDEKRDGGCGCDH